MIRNQVACDTETSGLTFVGNHIVGMSFSWGAENSYYTPIRHETGEKQLKMEDIIDDLRAIFEREDLTTIWFNAKFDLHFYLNEGITPRGIVHDVLIQHKLLRETGSAELKELAKQEIDPNSDMWEVAIDDFRTKKGREKLPSPTAANPKRMLMRKKANVHYGMIPINLMTPYAASDTHYTWALWKKKMPLVAENSELRQLYLMESQLLWVLLEMEHKGVYISRPYLEKAGPDLETEAAKHEESAYQKLGQRINLASNDELAKALQKLKIPLTKKTDKGKISLDVEVMERLATKYEVCEDILGFRQTKKLKSTYVDNILSKLDPDDYLHCTYNQNVTTGRMSSQGPNLQNIPAKTKTIRKAFVCPDGYLMVFIDYSQVEVRMTAHYSEDQILLDCYNVTHRDVHTNTLCEVFGYEYDEALQILDDNSHPTHEELSLLRKVAKTTNFLVIYGGGAENLRAKISSPKRQYSKEQCQKFIDQYFAKLRQLKKWINRTSAQVLQDKYVQNYFGRYRRFPELDGKFLQEWERKHCQRQAVNFLIQGTCADLFKVAMVRVGDILRGMRSRLVMTIHDELVFYIHKDELAVLNPIVKTMEDWHFKVPIIAEVSYAQDSWAGKKALHLS
jgi:DNA polymerase-1